MNDIFYFSKQSDFVNYADDDAIFKVSNTIGGLMKGLIKA